ncbi:MAG: protein kinase [Frankia sp.]|nr:protein kinase [Frankia sp.]
MPVLERPEVPEERRQCGVCGRPVGRGRDGRPGRVRGFCPSCRTPFSFSPALAAGDELAGYQIVGCLARGGQGWVYLALAPDRPPGPGCLPASAAPARQWVVLKEGLARSRSAAATARLALTVAHPVVVRTLDHIERDGVGYLVMEYVDGRSLREVLRERPAGPDGRPTPLPAAEGVALLRALLPVFGYLHARGLVYCDAKPDNVMVSSRGPRLIDLGALRRLGEPGGLVHTTAGYDAPELAAGGPPTVASDLYALGRLLAVTVLDLPDRTSAFRHRLPERDDDPTLARYAALDQFLRRATDPDPGRRFPNAAAMAAELAVTHREITAIDGIDGTHGILQGSVMTPQGGGSSR